MTTQCVVRAAEGNSPWRGKCHEVTKGGRLRLRNEHRSARTSPTDTVYLYDLYIHYICVADTETLPKVTLHTHSVLHAVRRFTGRSPASLRRSRSPSPTILSIYFLSNLQSLLGMSTSAIPYGLIYIYQNLWDDGLILF